MFNEVTPVTLPLVGGGSQQSQFQQVATVTNTIGIVDVAAFAASAGGAPPDVTMAAMLRRTRSVASSGNRSYLPSAHLSDYYIPAFDVTYYTKALPKRLQLTAEQSGRRASESQSLGPAAAPPQHRPRHSTAECRDECAPPHSITSSAAACGAEWSDRAPRGFEIERSNLVGRATGNVPVLAEVRPT